MSVLLELSLFPLDHGGSGLSRFIAPVVAMIAARGHPYQLTAMGTLVETTTMAEALALIESAHEMLVAQGCQRIYATIKLDSQVGVAHRLTAKVESVRARLDTQIASDCQTNLPPAGNQAP